MTELVNVAVDAATVLSAQNALGVDAASELASGYAYAAAAIAVGLAAIGSGYAERGIGSAAVGAMAEDSMGLGTGLLMTVLPETLVILALVVVFLAP